MALSSLGRWTMDEIRASADIAREKGVSIHLGADGSISIGSLDAVAEAPTTDEGIQREMPAIFSPSMLAKRWQCSERHVRNLMQTDQLAYFRLSEKLMRISLEEIQRVERAMALPEGMPSNAAEAGKPASTLERALQRVRVSNLRKPAH